MMNILRSVDKLLQIRLRSSFSGSDLPLKNISSPTDSILKIRNFVNAANPPLGRDKSEKPRSQKKLQNMNSIDQQFPRLHDLQHRFHSIESLLALAIPLILVVLMFNWRAKQSMKKQKNQRNKLLKKLNGKKGGEADEDEDDEVIKETIKLMEQKAKKLN
ncbi:hypothetical protein L5515_013415 [Caenorhabditis briggsae]|uniref:Uncharacterized protein n=1 Tax=Caenorhabditis briggsae TaxID=6238 RepID=A0AAE9E951_CAEBR|nr:hypothetical protein L5515_013415 [Caenorhabditis briggsae]